MDLTLVRSEFREDGIYGELSLTGDLTFLAVTLEHAYGPDLGSIDFISKLQPGTYICVRGQHRLHHMTQSFETFEVTGVPGHTDILFHVGNYNKDSDGCILLGEEFSAIDGEAVIMHSKRAFEAFMALQDGEDSFILTVKDR